MKVRYLVACLGVASVVLVGAVGTARAADEWFVLAEQTLRSSAMPRWSGRVPPDLDDVPVRVAELHAHVVRLVPPLDDVKPVRLDAIPKGMHFGRAGGTAAKVQERRQDNRVIDLSQRE